MIETFARGRSLEIWYNRFTDEEEQRWMYYWPVWGEQGFYKGMVDWGKGFSSLKEAAEYARKESVEIYDDLPIVVLFDPYHAIPIESDADLVAVMLQMPAK